MSMTGKGRELLKILKLLHTYSHFTIKAGQKAAGLAPTGIPGLNRIPRGRPLYPLKPKRGRKRQIGPIPITGPVNKLPSGPNPYVPRAPRAPRAPRGPRRPVQEAQRAARHRVQETQNEKFTREYMDKKRRGVLRRPGGITLGPLGQFGDDMICKIVIMPLQSNYKKDLSLNLIKTRVVRPFFNDLQAKINDLIERYVPIETGALQRSMKEMVTQAERYIDTLALGNQFLVHLGTPGIEYAKPVDRMPTAWLAHDPALGRKGPRSLKVLDDPTARHGWYSLVLLNARKEAKKLWDQYRLGVLANRLAPYKALNKSVNIQNEITKIIQIRIPGFN